MANDRSSVKGWRDFEAPSPSKTTEEAPQTPTTGALKLTWNGVAQALDLVAPGRNWAFDKLDDEHRNRLLETVLGELPVSVETVKAVIDEMTKPGEGGWQLAHSFRFVVEVAEWWLRQQNALSPEPDEATKYRNSFFADLNSRGGEFKVGGSQ